MWEAGIAVVNCQHLLEPHQDEGREAEFGK